MTLADLLERISKIELPVDEETLRKWWRNARENFDRGNWELAVQYYSSIEGVEKITDTDHLNKISVCHARLGQYTPSAAYLRRALEIGSTPELHCNLGAVLTHMNRYKEAEDQFRKAMAIDPAYKDAPKYLEEAAGMRKAAFRSRAKKLAVAGVGAVLLALGAFVWGQNRDFNRYVQEAKKCQSENNITCTIDSYKNALGIRDKDWLHLELGRLYRKSGNSKAALEELGLYIRRKPRDSEAHLELARLHEAEKSIIDAIAEYKNALKIDPNHKEAAAGLDSLIRSHLPKLTQFIVDVNGKKNNVVDGGSLLVDNTDKITLGGIISNSTSDNIIDVVGLGGVAQEKDMQFTLEDIHKTTAANLSTCDSCTNCCERYDVVARVPWTDDERGAFGKMSILFRTDAYYIDKADRLYKSRKWSSALKYYRKMSAAATDDYVLNQIAICYDNVGKHSLAMGYYELAVKAKPDDIILLNNLGASYEENGRITDAAEQYKKAFKIKPSDAESAKNLMRLIKIAVPNFSHVVVKTGGHDFDINPHWQLTVNAGQQVTISNVVAEVPWPFTARLSCPSGMSIDANVNYLHRTFTLDDIHNETPAWSDCTIRGAGYEIYNFNVTDCCSNNFGNIQLKFMTQ